MWRRECRRGTRGGRVSVKRIQLWTHTQIKQELLLYFTDFIYVYSYIPGQANCYRQSIANVRQWPSASTMALSNSGAKKPMSPSEFFAKIYGNDRNTTSDTSSSTDHDVATGQVVQLRPPLEHIPVQRESSSATWLYPAWNPADFWTPSTRPFYNPLALPPALTALSK